MKKVLLTLSLLFLVIGFSSAQEKNYYQAETAHYNIYSEVSNSNAEETGDWMEGLYAIYNTWFHLDEAREYPIMNVRIFRSKKGFDTYLKRFMTTGRNDFVYLHFSNIKKNELVCFLAEDHDFERSLAHHAFIQFSKTTFPGIPLWLREGFAIFFEDIKRDSKSGRLKYSENLEWLPVLKKVVIQQKEGITLQKLVIYTQKDLEKNSEIFLPQAWGLISFLYHSYNTSFNRILWDSISLLSETSSTSENSEYVKRMAFEWVFWSDLEKYFKDYVKEQKTFQGWMEEGISLYESEKYLDADKAFQEAIFIDYSHYLPYYYKGLISYAMDNFKKAEEYYRKGLENKAPIDLIYYAMGVNAYADDRNSDARNWLNRVVKNRSSKYKGNAEDLLDKLP